MKTNNLIVKDSCLECKNLYSLVTLGSCGCSDVGKSLIDAERSWLKRHGKLSEIKRPLKNYTTKDIEKPLKSVMTAMQKLTDESARLKGITKSLSDDLTGKNRKRKLRHSKLKLEITVSKMENSKTSLEQVKRKSLQRSDNMVILGVLDGLKGIELENWIEKRLK